MADASDYRDIVESVKVVCEVPYCRWSIATSWSSVDETLRAHDAHFAEAHADILE